MTSIGILFLLICIIQLLVIILWKKPKKILRPHEANKATQRHITMFLGAVIVVLYILFFMQLFKYHQPHPLTDTQYTQTKVYPTPFPKLVEPLGGRKTGSISTLYFLYKGSDKSQDTVTMTAWGLRQQYCKNLCIINLYDDKSAFEKDIERVSITSTDKMKEWNKQNYVFVADHYLGYLDAVQDAQFAYYPFHDSYYKHAKDGTLNSY